MLDGVMLLWFVLAAAALLFVAVDIRTTPESPVLKWGFVLLTAYTGVVGAFLYVLGCREPLPGPARALRRRAVAAGAGIDDALRRRRRRRHPRRRGARERLWYCRLGRDRPRIHSGLCLRLDDLPGAVHARHGRRLIPARADEHVHVGAAVDESADGGNGADSDGAEGANPGRGRSDHAAASGS